MFFFISSALNIFHVQNSQEYIPGGVSSLATGEGRLTVRQMLSRACVCQKIPQHSKKPELHGGLPKAFKGEEGKGGGKKYPGNFSCVFAKVSPSVKVVQ